MYFSTRNVLFLILVIIGLFKSFDYIHVEHFYPSDKVDYPKYVSLVITLVSATMYYSGRGLMGSLRDRPFLVLISGWFYYPAGLFSQKFQMFFKKWSQ